MDATGKGGSALESMPAGCGRRVGPSEPGPFAGETRAEARSLWPCLRNAGGVETGVGNMARDAGEKGESVKDSDLESRAKISL